MPKIDSASIHHRLACHYAEDVNKKYSFFGQVKTGRTAAARDGELHILDACAVRRSWSSPEIIGFEIKVSRGDFRGDEKWQNYLKFCNKLFFAAPRGLIKKSELPDGVGLVTVGGDGSLAWEKRALTLTPPAAIPASIYQYLVYSRLEVEDGMCPVHRKERRREHFHAAVELAKQGRYGGLGERYRSIDQIRQEVRDAAGAAQSTARAVQTADLGDRVAREVLDRLVGPGWEKKLYVPDWQKENTDSFVAQTADHLLRVYGDRLNKMDKVRGNLDFVEQQTKYILDAVSRLRKDMAAETT